METNFYSRKQIPKYVSRTCARYKLKFSLLNSHSGFQEASYLSRFLFLGKCYQSSFIAEHGNTNTWTFTSNLISTQIDNQLSFPSPKIRFRESRNNPYIQLNCFYTQEISKELMIVPPHSILEKINKYFHETLK